MVKPWSECLNWSDGPLQQGVLYIERDATQFRGVARGVGRVYFFVIRVSCDHLHNYKYLPNYRLILTVMCVCVYHCMFAKLHNNQELHCSYTLEKRINSSLQACYHQRAVTYHCMAPWLPLRRFETVRVKISLLWDIVQTYRFHRL